MEAERRGRPLHLGGPRVRLLLALLAMRAGEVVPAERLIDEMWGEDPPPTARKSLQVHISSLRKALGEEPPLATAGNGYVLSAEVDALTFEAMLADADRLAGGNPAEASATIEEAMSLWQGSPFADLAGEEALAIERTRLTELRLRALEQRARALLALGRHQEVIPDLETLTAEHPYREEPRALHMLALYRSGRQAEALQAYQSTRKVLAEDLGIDPSPDLQELEQRILDQNPELAAPTPPAPSVSTLPARQSDLIGREADIVEVQGLLSSARMVTLTGVGGCGKTSLAVEVAHRLVQQFPGGVFFCDLTTVTDDEGVQLGVVAGIQLTLSGGARITDQLVNFLVDRQCLLVLDNCEHVLDGCADLLDTLLRRCSRLVVLATSREAISITGEHAWRVPSLAAEGTDSPAVELFLIRAREADAAFRVEAEDKVLVAEICQRLDGIPLAIELAAARTRSMTVTEIRDHLDDRFRLLSGGRRRAAQRQQTLAEAVEWSYSLLAEKERAMLRRLSVFQGGFDLADVAPVTGFGDTDAIDLVDSLVAKSLVDVTRQHGAIVRRRLLETIRLFALHQLVATEEATETRERHFQHFAGRMAGTSAAMNQYVALLVERNQRELDNIMASIDWAIETDRRAEAVLTVGRVVYQLINRGLLSKYLPLLDDDHVLERPDHALLLSARAGAAWAQLQPEKVPAITEAARRLLQGEVLDDMFDPLIVSMTFAPIEGAEERLAELDRLLPLAEKSPVADRNISIIELQRAGQFYSLGRLEEALEAATRSAYCWASGGSVEWGSMIAMVALLILLDRREEAMAAVAEIVEDSYQVDIARGLCQAGAGRPEEAGAAMAASARRWVSGRVPFQESEYLCLFAAYRTEMGDDQRADTLLRVARPRLGTIHWLVWPYVWRWSTDEFVERNREARTLELEALAEADAQRTTRARLLAEESAFWQP